MKDYLYTVIYRGQSIVHLNNIEIAREALYELQGGSYIQYNESGKKKYQEARDA